MIRIREIPDPELRQKLLAALAERRGCSVAAIPDWFELDDLDLVDLLNDLKESEGAEDPDDPRMGCKYPRLARVILNEVKDLCRG